MSKKFQKRIPTLDLHGVRHADVFDRVNNWIYLQSLPAHIITGNSDKMKKLVSEFLDSFNYSYIIGDTKNQGYIKIINHESQY